MSTQASNIVTLETMLEPNISLDLDKVYVEVNLFGIWNLWKRKKIRKGAAHGLKAVGGSFYGHSIKSVY